MRGPVHQVASEFACLYRVGRMELVVEAKAPTDRGTAAYTRSRTGTGLRAFPTIRVVRAGPVAGHWQTTSDGHGSLQAYPRRADVWIVTSSTRAGRRRAISAMRVVAPKLDGRSNG